MDYVIADALMCPERDGKIKWLWQKNILFEDPEDFMERYVQFNIEILNEPIHIWVSPTFYHRAYRNITIHCGLMTE